MVTLHEVITFLVSMQISISSMQTHNVNRCGRSRHLARKLSLRRKRSSPNVFEMAATETITSIILIKLIRVSLGTVRHRRRFNIVVIDIQITLKQMLRDFFGIRVNRAKKSGMVNITSSVNSRERSGINTILHELTPLFTDRKSGSAGMPRPISYAVFCLKKKTAVAYATAAAMGIPAMLGEDGGAGQYEAAIATRMHDGLQNVLRVLDMIPGGARNMPAPRRFEKFNWVRTQGPGFFRAEVNFFFNDTATPEIYTLSLHDALPI